MAAARYTAAWDGKLIAVTTGGVSLIVAGMAVAIWVALQLDGAVLRTAVGLMALPGAVVLAVTYWWSPRAYSIDDDAVRIERAAGPVVVPVASIREVRELPSQERMRRVFGSGGLFGYFGTFRSARLGTVSLYATSSHGRVLIVTSGGPVVLTPEPASGFIEALRARLERR